MRRAALSIIIVLGLIGPAWASWDEAYTAYKRGDYAEVLRLLQPLLEQGQANAQNSLGFMYQEGHGVPQDYATAAAWYRKSAEQNYALAQYSLGSLYLKGEGVVQNYPEAEKWYRRAAEQGLAQAQYDLGNMYGNGWGLPHVPLDNTEAVNWYRKAADQGFGPAQNAMGNKARLYGYMAAAVKWYRKAAEQGFAAAQANLGLMYQDGHGVPEDYVQAHKWLNLAASRFPASEKKLRDLAVNNRDLVAAKMTSAQIVEAERLAREWKPKAEGR